MLLLTVGRVQGCIKNVSDVDAAQHVNHQLVRNDDLRLESKDEIKRGFSSITNMD